MVTNIMIDVLPGDNDILWCIGYEIGYNDGYYGKDGRMTLRDFMNN